jgi:hypothetical protein
MVMMATDRIQRVLTEAERLDQATRTAMHVESYLAKRRVLETALNDIAVLKHTLRQLAAEIEPRLQGIEGRLVVLARTVGNLLADLDRGHTTTVTRLRNPITHADPHVETTRIDPNAPTPLPGAGPGSQSPL